MGGPPSAGLAGVWLCGGCELTVKQVAISQQSRHELCTFSRCELTARARTWEGSGWTPLKPGANSGVRVTASTSLRCQSDTTCSEVQ
jgi:hypothetical protein